MQNARLEIFANLYLDNLIYYNILLYLLNLLNSDVSVFNIDSANVCECVRYDISSLSKAFFRYWIEHRRRIFIFGTVIHARTIALPPLSLPLSFQMSESRHDLFLLSRGRNKKKSDT